MIVLHVIIALASVVAATASLARISTKLLLTAKILSAATLATGTYLVVSLDAPLLTACAEGLAYLAIVATVMTFAGRRIALKRTSASI